MTYSIFKPNITQPQPRPLYAPTLTLQVNMDHFNDDRVAEDELAAAERLGLELGLESWIINISIM
jgi:hypothetical protein